MEGGLGVRGEEGGDTSREESGIAVDRVAGTSRSSLSLLQTTIPLSQRYHLNPGYLTASQTPASHPQSPSTRASRTPKAHMAILATHPERGGEKRK